MLSRDRLLVARDLRSRVLTVICLRSVGCCESVSIRFFTALPTIIGPYRVQRCSSPIWPTGGSDDYTLKKKAKL